MRTFCSAGLLIALLGCTPRETLPSLPPPSRPAPVPASPIAGCYNLQWRPSKPFRDPLEIPHDIELSNIRTDEGRYRIRSREPMPSYMWMEWELATPSEVHMTWSTGFVGFVISVPVVSNSLGTEGVAETFSDVPERPGRARVRITHIDCSSPPLR